jgi:hypothetical protein
MDRMTPENKKRWQMGVDAGATWAETAPVERLTKIVTDLDHDRGRRLGEDRDPLSPMMRVLADLLDKLEPDEIAKADTGNYYPLGFRSGILLTWHTRHAPIVERN